MRHPALVLFIVFSFMMAAFAQTAPATSSTQQSSASQSTQTQTAPTYTSGSPVIQYADDKLAVVAWKAATNGEGRVYYGTDPNNLNLVAEDTTNSTSHRVHLAN